MSFYVENRLLHKKDGTLVGRLERGTVCDDRGETLLLIKGNAIHNKYNAIIARVEKGEIISTSGGVLARLSDARKTIDRCNDLSDIEVAALWMPFVKGIR